MTAPPTWLRVVIQEAHDADHDTSLAYLTANIPEFTRVLEDQPGFVVAYWGHDPDDGTIAAVTHWRSRHAITDADLGLQKLQAGFQAHGIQVLHVQNLELFPIPVTWSTCTDGDRGGTMRTTGATWLRVVTYAHDPGDERADDYMEHNIQDCLRVLERQPGFELGYWGRDLDESTMAAVTYWNSREAIDDAGPALDRLQAEAADHGVRRVDVRNVRLFALPPV